MRHAALARRLNPRRAQQALCDLIALPLRRAPHLALLPRIWELRENITAYDAAYVALAEAIAAPLLMSDARFAAAPRLHCEVELLR